MDAIEEVVAAAPEKDRQRLDLMLRTAISRWPERESYRAIREHAASEASGDRDFLLLEVGAAGSGSYRAYWYLEAPPGATVLSVSFRVGGILKLTANLEKWEKVRSISGENFLSECPSNSRVRDGAAYSLTIKRASGATTVAAYGIIPEALPESSKCKTILDVLMELPSPATV